MDDYTAISIAEGFADNEEYSDEEQIAAWQHLIDTGLAWRLQGWFGRSASAMIDEGVCSSPKSRNVSAHDSSPCIPNGHNLSAES